MPAEGRPSPVQNLLTVDWEEWFVVEALSAICPRETWETLPSTIVPNTRRLLKLFRKYNAKATFFTVGWCADKHPNLLSEVAADGHEIACHSYYHRRVDSLSPEEFQNDTQRAIDAILKSTGGRVLGYRAPSWSMGVRTPWAFETLSKLGFEYDSSIFPIKHDIYGMPNGPRKPFRMQFTAGRTLLEVPGSTFRLMGANVPFGGGGFLRHSPYWYTKQRIEAINEAGDAVNVYLHPWEIDSDPPRIPGLSALQRFRMYSSTGHMEARVERLLADFEFITMSEYLSIRRRQQIGFR
jgi:polysaccharide deacetylase family protein (PEP-CTERM system associated)